MTMIGISTGKEWVIFAGIIAIVGIAALAAFQISGPMSIEERFQNALGISGDGGKEPEGSGFLGFSIEGQPLLYTGIVCGLGIVCYGAYRHFRI
jgi:hypothetical protein